MLKKWAKERMEVHIQESLIGLKSAKVFLGKSMEERKRFLDMFFCTEPSTHRLILCRVLNKGIGGWKSCGKCGQCATKMHLEQCVPAINQSDGCWIDQRLSNTRITSERVRRDQWPCAASTRNSKRSS